jgi:hypothetical protein
VTSEGLITSLAIGFLFTGGAAILGDAPAPSAPLRMTFLELGEGVFADRTGALQGGFPLGFIQFV